ncbi:MAG TPA: hypothetical protein PLL20_17140 [Phycisphaerae bacterium]|nr:hypothetical protein [Phycisphaerae bacterium]HPD31719.1 hypothetical protein [Phycisphaerae bacterium]HRR85616.1 hypothetical protein [Phycisphaerae bacterium]
MRFGEGLPHRGGQPGGVIVGVAGQFRHGVLESLALGFQLPDLPRYRPLGRGVDVRVHQEPGHRADPFVEFADLAANPLELVAVGLHQFPRFFNGVFNDRVGIGEDLLVGRLDPVHQQVFPDVGHVVAGVAPVSLTAAASVVVVLALAVLAGPPITHAAALFAEDQPGERPVSRGKKLAGVSPRSRVQGQPILCFGEGSVVNDPQAFITLHDVL